LFLLAFGLLAACTDALMGSELEATGQHLRNARTSSGMPLKGHPVFRGQFVLFESSKCMLMDLRFLSFAVAGERRRACSLLTGKKDP
jgi:hypothetical protein